jgi:hypothetical protein
LLSLAMLSRLDLHHTDVHRFNTSPVYQRTGRVPVLAPMVTYARDGTIEVQTNDDGGSEARREPDLAC